LKPIASCSTGCEKTPKRLETRNKIYKKALWMQPEDKMIFGLIPTMNYGLEGYIRAELSVVRLSVLIDACSRPFAAQRVRKTGIKKYEGCVNG
jgi:hypothetical protein